MEDVEVVGDSGEGGGVLVDDGGHHDGLGGRRRPLLRHLVEAGVVAVPPHVPATSALSQQLKDCTPVMAITNIH